MNTDNEKLLVELRKDCWLWAGVCSAGGYGVIRVEGKYRGAHRLIYEALVDEIPEGLVPDHLCEIKRCVNPSHIEPVTPGENILRHYRRQTHCVKGHEYTPENISWRHKRTNKTLARYCRTCKNASMLKRYYKLKSLAPKDREDK